MIMPEERESLMRAMEIKEPIIDAISLPIHRQLKVKRVTDNFTQAELATMLGMGISTLSEIENGKRRIPYKHIELVNSYLYNEMYDDKEFMGFVEQ